jgi:hypothetical protein
LCIIHGPADTNESDILAGLVLYRQRDGVLLAVDNI